MTYHTNTKNLHGRESRWVSLMVRWFFFSDRLCRRLVSLLPSIPQTSFILIHFLFFFIYINWYGNGSNIAITWAVHKLES
ncbi:hypothetical protein IF1G_11236 [Cordyceps javanica]|uniref:Uncharacterized protein n=1 Tax=Cordyceps javanica TaxID=43265 RepID=A0A545UKV5_9HYPO|nr:hypothetical protein IF1G_11236 [Cordyceps javanica]